MGRSNQAQPLPLALFAGFLHYARRPAVGLIDDFRGLAARFRHQLLDPFLRRIQFTAPLGGGLQAVGYLLVALVDGVKHLRPDELHREPDERKEYEALRQQCRVDAHMRPLTRRR